MILDFGDRIEQLHLNKVYKNKPNVFEQKTDMFKLCEYLYDGEKNDVLYASKKKVWWAHVLKLKAVNVIHSISAKVY